MKQEGEGGQGTWEGCLEAVRAPASACVPQELVEYYQCHSLKESFKQLDTTLKYPYKSRERAASRASSRSPGNARTCPAHQRSLCPFPTALASPPPCP